MKKLLLMFVAVYSHVALGQSSSGTYPIVYTGSGAGQYTTIRAAIAALPSTGGQVFINCGTYSDNLTLATSNIKLQGAGIDCVTIHPANAAAPVVAFHQTSTAPMQYDELSDLTISCPSSCTADAIEILGDTANIQNDWHKLTRLVINGPFLNGIEITGRTIWSVFENIQASGAQHDGFHINLPSTVAFNFNVFRDSRSASNGEYGVYFASTNTNAPPESNAWDRIDIENNSGNVTSDCAGFYANGVGGGNSITGSYFESNCESSSDSTASHVRLTGTYNEGWTIIGNQFNNVANQWAIYNDTNWTGGVYSSNLIIGTGKSIYISTSNSNSQIFLGNNILNGVTAPQIVPDANSVTHVVTLSTTGLTNAISGTRFVCVDQYGNLVSKTTACSGT
jgi:hypothetical protein